MKISNHFFILFILIILLFISPAAQGADKGDDIFDISLMLTHFYYKEITNNMILDSETGYLPGVELTYVHQPSDSNIFLRASTNLSYGDLKYNGSTWGGTPLSFIHSNTTFNIEGDIGYAFGRKKIFIPYIGIGHTYWYRGINSSTPGDYSETYSLYYFPVGLVINLIQNGDVNLSIDGAVRYMFNGTVTAFFSGMDPGFNDVGLNLGSTIGESIKVNFTYLLDKGLSLLVIPWYERSSNGQSNTGILSYYGTPISIVQEPSSVTDKFGINVGIRIIP